MLEGGRGGKWMKPCLCLSYTLTGAAKLVCDKMHTVLSRHSAPFPFSLEQQGKCGGDLGFTAQPHSWALLFTLGSYQGSNWSPCKLNHSAIIIFPENVSHKEHKKVKFITNSGKQSLQMPLAPTFLHSLLKRVTLPDFQACLEWLFLN